MRRRSPGLLLSSIVTILLAWATPVVAQDEGTRPAFSLATSHVFTTRESPALTLTHRHLDHLDFRVYRVNDTFGFFAKLRDAHELGSEDPVVPQEQTWLERIAAWKAQRRTDLRSFARRQFSPTYRRVRNQLQDRQQVVLRRTLNVNNFAQVPLLNASQLVTSWLELLPPVRDAEVPPHSAGTVATRRVRGGGGEPAAARLHRRDRVGRGPGHEDGSG